MLQLKANEVTMTKDNLNRNRSRSGNGSNTNKRKHSGSSLSMEAPKSAPPATPPAVKRPVLTAEDVRPGLRLKGFRDPGSKGFEDLLFPVLEKARAQGLLDSWSHAVETLKFKT